ncbi:MAG: ABC transporter substrate-binding protein/permease [Oscillospiraceae bacterium]|nr:ABC transporter substrate-binding protein/permease [Oscillospiraceae bacterium]
MRSFNFKIKKFRFALVLLMMSIVAVASVSCDMKKSETGLSKIHTIDDLEGATIGVQLGTTGDIFVSDYEEKGSVVERFTKAADAVQALKLGKIDCIVIDRAPANAFVGNNPELSILEEDFAVEEYAICISKEKTELKNQINESISVLKENGTLESIISNYIGDDTKGKFPYVSPENVDRSNGTLRVATNATFEPYEYMEGGEIVGIDIDIARAICDILGMNLKIEDIEFDSIISAVQSGKSDIGLSGMTVTEDRLKSIDFTQSYTTATQVVIVNTGSSNEKLSFKDKFHNNFIVDSRWKNITNGLLVTLQISFFAVLIGVVLGFVIAIMRSTCDKTGKYKILNLILKAYLTIIRGTPTMVQLLIIYYVIFASTDINKVLVAVIAFGLNSSAYIAEIVRGGIMAVDEGQFEAGRSLGFNYNQTMWYFILPQAFRTVLPSLCNEFIVLIKETSISGYIGIMDLTRGGDYIRSRTYEAFMPLVAVALVYLILVVVLTWLVSKLEKRLKNDGK